MAYQAKSAVEVQLDVLGALMVRDMRTRFGGTMWGYGIAVGWPCAHILVITAAYAVMKKPTPIGDSIVLFAVSVHHPQLHVEEDDGGANDEQAIDIFSTS